MESVAPGVTATLTEIERRQKPLRLIDRRPKLLTDRARVRNDHTPREAHGQVRDRGDFEIAEGRMGEFLPLLLAHRDRCLGDEPGTLRLDVLRPRTEAGTVLLYEVYENDAAFQVHWNGPSVARMRSETAGMVTKLTGTRCMLLD